jgi:class 3 adenylate cyclase
MRLFRTPQMPFRRSSMHNVRFVPRASEIGAIRIRAILHTGPAEERGGDYFGLPLNRAARLLAAGHGDQTLLSQATQELVYNSLPPGVSLLDLGEHRLKDVLRPERVFHPTFISFRDRGVKGAFG